MPRIRSLHDIEMDFQRADKVQSNIEQQYHKFTNTVRKRVVANGGNRPNQYIEELMSERKSKFGIRRSAKDQRNSDKNSNLQSKRHRFWGSIEAVHVDEYQDIIAQQDDILRDFKTANYKPKSAPLRLKSVTMAAHSRQKPSRMISSSYLQRPATSLSITTLSSAPPARRKERAISPNTFISSRTQTPNTVNVSKLEPSVSTRSPLSSRINTGGSIPLTESQTDTHSMKSPIAQTLSRLNDAVKSQIKQDLGESKRANTTKSGKQFDLVGVPFICRLKIGHVSNPSIWRFDAIFRDHETLGHVFTASNVDFDEDDECLVVIVSEHVETKDLPNSFGGKAFNVDIFQRAEFSEDVQEGEDQGGYLRSFLVSFTTQGNSFVSSQFHQQNEYSCHTEEESFAGYSIDSSEVHSVKSHYLDMSNDRVYDLPFSPFSDAFKSFARDTSQSKRAKSTSLQARVEKRFPHTSTAKRHDLNHDIPSMKELLAEWKSENIALRDGKRNGQKRGHSAVVISSSFRLLTKNIDRLKPSVSIVSEASRRGLVATSRSHIQGNFSCELESSSGNAPSHIVDSDNSCNDFDEDEHEDIHSPGEKDRGIDSEVVSDFNHDSSEEDEPEEAITEDTGDKETHIEKEKKYMIQQLV